MLETIYVQSNEFCLVKKLSNKLFIYKSSIFNIYVYKQDLV